MSAVAVAIDPSCEVCLNPRARCACLDLDALPSVPPLPRLDERRPGVRAAVAALVGPVPEALEDEPTRPSRLHVHLSCPESGLLPCGAARGNHVESRDPARVTCRPCLVQALYPTAAEALLALGRLGVQVEDTAQAQARGLLVVARGAQHLAPRQRSRLLWRLDLDAAALPPPPKADVELLREAQAAAEPARPVHWSEWGRCLDEHEDDLTADEPEKVTCTECLRLIKEDEAQGSKLTPEQQAAGRDAELTPEQVQELRTKLLQLWEGADPADPAALEVRVAELAEEAANELGLFLADEEATILEAVFEQALEVLEQVRQGEATHARPRRPCGRPGDRRG